MAKRLLLALFGLPACSMAAALLYLAKRIRLGVAVLLLLIALAGVVSLEARRERLRRAGRG